MIYSLCMKDAVFVTIHYFVVFGLALKISTLLKENRLLLYITICLLAFIEPWVKPEDDTTGMRSYKYSHIYNKILT